MDAGRSRVEPLIAKWKSTSHPPDTKEICRRLIDLFLVSVLLDAGAGNTWAYIEPVTGQKFSRSEGLVVASIHMFEDGFFSSNKENPYQVDGESNVHVRDRCFTIPHSGRTLANHLRADNSGYASQRYQPDGW